GAEYVSCGKFPKLFQGLCAAQYELDCHLYDRPGTQLSWNDLFGAYANVDPGEPLRPDAGSHGRRLVVAQPRVARESPGTGQTAWRQARSRAARRCRGAQAHRLRP